MEQAGTTIVHTNQQAPVPAYKTEHGEKTNGNGGRRYGNGNGNGKN